MRKRRGRPRKSGARHPGGKLKARQAETPRQVAAMMPHRKGLGDLAVDQRAETQLGRLVLREMITPTQGLAGQTYHSLWRGYVFSIAGPEQIAAGGSHGFSCGGCEEPKYCRCWFRRKVYEEARRVLQKHGAQVLMAVRWTVLIDQPPGDLLEPLKIGLSALARHFGLTARGTSGYQNAASEISSPA